MKNHRRAFTLIEMMVAVSIAVVIMAVIMFNYSAFNDNILLSSAGQEVAIAVRQAQTYGLSVKESGIGSGNFNYGYGIYFSVNDPTNYYIFIDLNGNNQYDVSGVCPGGECVQKMSLPTGVKISSICGAAFLGSMACPGFQSADITFLRPGLSPSQNANIRFIDNTGALTGTYQTGRIVFISPLGKTLNVDIENTSQISVH
jgi:prepilin-type N-terminal cleavage/methylation domain-containing protein